MKLNILVAAVTLVISTLAQAASSAPCRLHDSADDYQDSKRGKWVQQIDDLSKLEQKRVLITALDMAKQNAEFEEKVVIETPADALKYLKDGSEGGDVYVGAVMADNQVYSVVRYYPGGNPVGLIFRPHTTKVIGEIQDSSVNCRP